MEDRFPNGEYPVMLTPFTDNNEVDYDVVKQNIVERDALQEEAGYYKIYDKTIKIDVTNCKTIEESTNEVLKHINIKNR